MTHLFLISILGFYILSVAWASFEVYNMSKDDPVWFRTQFSYFDVAVIIFTPVFNLYVAYVIETYKQI